MGKRQDLITAGVLVRKTKSISHYSLKNGQQLGFLVLAPPIHPTCYYFGSAAVNPVECYRKYLILCICLIYNSGLE